jgi:hypothetical protein
LEGGGGGGSRQHSGTMNLRTANRISQLLTRGSNLAIREHCTAYGEQRKETGTLVVELLERPAKLESVSTEEVTGEASGKGEVQVGQGEGSDSVRATTEAWGATEKSKTIKPVGCQSQ